MTEEKSVRRVKLVGVWKRLARCGSECEWGEGGGGQTRRGERGRPGIESGSCGSVLLETTIRRGGDCLVCDTHDASPQWAKFRNARPKWAAAAPLPRKVGAFLDERCSSPCCHVQTG